MKKSMSSEAVLSACQVQAVRLNNLEYRRLQRHVDTMHGDLQLHLARLQRQAQGLKVHFTNVVRVLKPNRGYQAWKQAHAREIAEDTASDWIGPSMNCFYRSSGISCALESIKVKEKSRLPAASPSPAETKPPARPLLLLLESVAKEPVEPIINFEETFRRPKTSPAQPFATNHIRANPLLNILIEKTSRKSPLVREHTFAYQSTSSLPSVSSDGSRKSPQSPSLAKANTPNLDTLYRIALQNATAYKAVEQKHIDKRKLNDRDFASRHRAMKGSIRSAGVVN